MTPPLLLVAGCAFVASLVSFAVVLALGPVNFDDWQFGGHRPRFSGPAVMGDGPVVTRDLAWGEADTLRINIPAAITYTQGPVVKFTVTGPKGTVDNVDLDDESLSFSRRVRNPGRVDVVVTAPTVSKFVLNGTQTLAIGGYQQDRLEVKVNGAGAVKATGRAREVDMHISGTGDVDLGGVAADDAEVHIAGAGKATISPKVSAEVHIAGAGDVILTTRPPHFEQHIAGSGRIIQGPAAPAT